MKEMLIRKGTIMTRTTTLALLGFACLMALPSAAHARYRDGMNLYQYVRSGPSIFVDPGGLDASTPAERVNLKEYCCCVEGMSNVPEYRTGGVFTLIKGRDMGECQRALAMKMGFRSGHAFRMGCDIKLKKRNGGKRGNTCTFRWWEVYDGSKDMKRGGIIIPKRRWFSVLKMETAGYAQDWVDQLKRIVRAKSSEATRLWTFDVPSRPVGPENKGMNVSVEGWRRLKGVFVVQSSPEPECACKHKYGMAGYTQILKWSKGKMDWDRSALWLSADLDPVIIRDEKGKLIPVEQGFLSDSGPPGTWWPPRVAGSTSLRGKSDEAESRDRLGMEAFTGDQHEI